MKCHPAVTAFVLCVAFIIGMKGCGDALAHQTDGFKHFHGSTGPIVGAVSCDTGINRWTRKDGSCFDFLFIHNTFHIKELDEVRIVRTKKGICTCEELTLGGEDD